MTGAAIALDVMTELGSQVGDSVLSVLEGDLAFLALGVEYQQAVADWLAVAGGFLGGARLGIEAESILSQGVTSFFAYQLRARARVLATENWQLSANLRFQPITQYGLDPIGFVQRAIEDGGITDENSLVAEKLPPSSRITTRPSNVGVSGWCNPRLEWRR